ncbi:MAG: hypothetical protein ACK51K_19125 [Gammaproteobacteria bacterium]|jgi:hypothetical protein
MIHLVYRMRLTARAQQDMKGFWAWLEERERWFYRDLPMVKGVRWFTTVIGESYVLECWAAFEDEAGWGAYRSGLASLKRDADWESRRTSQGEWWTFLDSRIVGDVPCRVGFGQMGATNSNHSPAAPSTLAGSGPA